MNLSFSPVACHAHYLRYCYQIAAYSGDTSTQNGAVLVDPKTGEIVAQGVNDLPLGVCQCPERRARPAKYSFTEHAERNAIYDAAKKGIKTNGLVMYANWFACSDCARGIIQAGISQVIGHEIPQHSEQPQWKESVKDGILMLQEAGVVLDWYKEQISGVEILFAGQRIKP
jgi:dCMP deaminase